MRYLISPTIADFKLIFRDSSLQIFLGMPLLIFAVVLLAVPALVESYGQVEQYVPIIMMGAVLQTSTMFGFIYSMILIHEKDMGVARVYGVLPVSKKGFVSLRLVMSLVISTAFTFALLVVQPFYALGTTNMIVLSIVCGLLAPVLALAVTILSKNKMEGLTWFKLVNLLVAIPLAAFFIPKYEVFFGVLPTYWIYKSLDLMIMNMSALWPLVIGYSFLTVILIFLVFRFSKVHFS